MGPRRRVTELAG
uniref:Uncharacterized protein n=1 Tax=Anguilla anguilla TaxID=7936 RepID=A0A0E9QRB2_ANGAN